jgi:broad specificity phosphatase PhoE
MIIKFITFACAISNYRAMSLYERMFGYPTGLKKGVASDRNIKRPMYKDGGDIGETEEKEEDEEKEEKEEKLAVGVGKIKRDAFLYMDPFAAFFFLRHGVTEWNKESGNTEKVRGFTEIKLLPEGEKSAYKAADELKKRSINVIISCDLGRTRTTAEIVSKTLGIPVSEYTKSLRPWNMGNFEGQDYDKVKDQLDWYARHENAKIPGGESLKEFKERMLPYMDSIKTRYRGKNVLIVTHSKNVMLYNAWMAEGFSPAYDIDIKTYLDKGAMPETGQVEPVEWTMLNNFAKCMSCKMFIPSKKLCSLHGKDQEVTKDLTCGLYCYGQSEIGELEHVSKVVTAKESGLRKAGSLCENCRYYCEEDSECDLFEMLNKMSPDVFALDDMVNKHGCCNAQMPNKKEEQEEKSESYED